MTHLRVLLAAALLLGAAAGSQTVLTRDGRRLVGEVSQEGEVTVVRTLGETIRVPNEQVIIIFSDPREAAARADARFEQAKRLYDEATQLPDRDRARVDKLSVAIDVLGHARDIYQHLERHYTTESFQFIASAVSKVMQLMRLCRDAKGSEMSGGAELTKAAAIGLESGNYRVDVPPPLERPWVDTQDLGPGQVGVVKLLEQDEPKTRHDALKKLMSPPAPHAVPAVIALIEREANDEVLKAIGDFLDAHRVMPTPRQLAWARKEVDLSSKRRAVVIAFLKRAGDKASCEFLAEWLIESPPTDNVTRAHIASAFRKMREFAVVDLNKVLTKTRERPAQIEVIKQMGMLRDRRLAGTIIQTIGPYPSYSIVALLTLGREAVPDCTRAMRGGSQDQRKYCTWVCRKVSGLDNLNPGPFEDWFVKNKKDFAEEEEKWWKEQAEQDYPVKPEDFRLFDRKLEDILK